ncbi:MAG: PAS domain S-box protein [Desulfuromonadaceae bacterium]|nr:PAS domain S-box protein [Desulfuromonadaceae bacterium]
MLLRPDSDNKASIKNKVTLTVFVTVTVMVLVVSWILFSYFHTVLRDSIFKQQFTLVSEIAEQLNGRVELARHQLSLAATNIDSSVLSNPLELQRALTAASPTSMIFDAGFLVIGTGGRVLAESMGYSELVGRDFASNEYIIRALKSGTPVLSKPFQFTVPPNPAMIAMVVPIRDDNDRVICLLAGYHSLDSDEFLTSLSSKGIGTGGYLYLINNRTILSHPDKSRILEVIPEGKNKGIDKALLGFEGSLDNVSSKGQQVLSSFRKVGDTGWILVANIPSDEAFKPLTELAYNAIMLSVCGIIISLLVVWFVTRGLTRPISLLTHHIDSFTSGVDAWQPIEIKTGDEIERLSVAFNTMLGEMNSAKQMLKDERDFFSGVIQNAAAPMFVIDSNHTILFWNDALVKLTGKSSREMVTTKLQWSPFYTSERPVLADLVIDHNLKHIDKYYSEFERSRFIDGSYQAEGWFDDINGKRRYLFFEASPIMNSHNEIAAAVETLEDITDRKLAQEKLSSHNIFLQEILDTIPNPVFYKDITGAYIGCNKSFQAFVGRSLPDLIGKTIADIMPGIYAVDTLQHDAEVISGRSGFSYESELLRYDGQIRHVLITKAPFYSIDGDLGGIVGAFVDVTEQQKLDEQTRKMSRAVEQSPATIVITDVDGNIEYVNPKFLQTTGYTFAEAIGQNPRILKSGELSPEGYAELWKTITSGREWRGEFHNMRRDGTLYWEYASISPLYDKEHRISGYLAIKEDITDRKAVEAELANSRLELEEKHGQLEHLFSQVELAKREWEQTLDHLQDFVILTDADHRIRRFNKLLSEATGKPYATLLGSDWRELIYAAGFRFVTFDGVSGEMHHPGSGRTYDITIYSIKNVDEVTGYVVSLNDTTELRIATQELEKTYSELKEAQVQIFQQEKMASIGQLAAGVAHEINNPMGFISSNLTTLNKYIDRLSEFIAAGDQILVASAGSEETENLKALRKRLKIDYIMDDSRQLITESQDGAGRVRRIVQDLKSFSRVDQAESALLNLNDALETTINIAWNEIKYVATLTREFGDIPAIKCHPQQLNQVFLNLLVNAAHALGNSQGIITVRTWYEEEHVFVSIADTGCGIAEDIQKRIFEPFFTTKEVGKGTGLGLSISYDIIRKHGGSITVESEIGRGATFIVKLPVDGPKELESAEIIEQV